MKNRNSCFYWKNIIYGNILSSNIKVDSVSIVEQIFLKIFNARLCFLSWVLGHKRGQSKNSFFSQDIGEGLLFLTKHSRLGTKSRFSTKT